MRKLKDRSLIRIQPLRITVAKLRKETLSQAVPIVDVEPELVVWAQFHTDFVLDRYRASPSHIHWPEAQSINMRLGLLAQKIFQAILLEYSVPHDYNDPLFGDERGRWKPYDFYIQGLGSVEVKAIPPGERCKRLMIKVSEWKKNDYVVAIKIMEEELQTAYLMGYLTGKEAEGLPKKNFGHATAYWTYLDRTECEKEGLLPLHSASELLGKIIRYGVKYGGEKTES